ncbi:MAG: CAP domain-containing protein [Gemmatimonadetes bacterium]|nr:CAP domain-containing protein [Gemmatimonadota bacterium]
MRVGTRTRRATAALLLFGVGALTGCRTAAPNSPGTPAPPPVDGALSGDPVAGACPSGRTQAAFEAINRLRSDRGLGALRPNTQLAAAAQGHARDLAEHGMRGHRGSDGSMPVERATRAGYRWTLVGENVAGGYSSPASVIGGWMASPPHRENLLQPGFREAGIAWADAGAPTGFVWVLVLGDRAGVPDGPLGCAG